MKKFFSNLVIVSTIFLSAGCQRDTLSQDEPASPGTSLPQITAYNADASSKTVLSDDGTKLLWNPGDVIAVFFNSFRYLYYSINTQPKEEALFIADNDIGVGLEPISEPYMYAVYPYVSADSQEADTLFINMPYKQKALAGSVAQDCFISVGRSKDTNIPFYNLCGGICFSVSEPDVKHVFIQGNCNECIAGSINVMFNKDGYPVVSGIRNGVARIELTASADEGFELGKKYYISILPVCFENGFTMTFMKDKSMATLTTSKEVYVKRSTFGNLGVADQGLEYEDVVPQSVDLGLSVKWATFNIGATVPEMFGQFFKFGEVEGTLWGDSLSPDMKFPEYEIDTTDYHLLPQYDAAAVNWGSGWRMPSKAESDELIKGTLRERVKNYKGTGLSGYLFTSKIAGYTDKSIFMPSDEVYYLGDIWYYWTGTSVPSYPDICAFFMDSDSWYYTYNRAPIRPVIE